MFNIFHKNNIIEQEPRKFSFYVFVIAFILSAVSFLFLIDNSKNYCTETSIILIPKSEKAAQDSEHIIENLKIFPTKLGFYNKLLKDNSNIKDNFFGFSDNQREQEWNKNLKIKREDKSSIIKISIKASDSEEAKYISDATISTLFSVISFYYNIKNDVDLRIIEGPTIHTEISNWFLITLLSLVIGTIISFLVNFISIFISNSLVKNGEKVKSQFEKSFFKFNFESKKTIENIAVQKNETTKNIPAILKPSVEIKKTSSAPQNLPGTPGNLSFIDEDYFRTTILKGGKPTEKTIEVKTENQKVPQESASADQEPTQEELKRRLNQLLRGEL